MHFKKFFCILFVIFVFSCNKKQKYEIKDYDVINQVLMKYSDKRICICDYREFPVFFDKWYPENFSNKEKAEIIRILKKRKFNTDNINFTHFELLLVKDSLRGFKHTGFKSEKTTRLDLNKLFSSKSCILYQSNSIFKKKGGVEKYISLSRVLLNETEDKAVFKLTIFFSGLNSHCVTVYAELKNGTWVIVNKKLNWIS